MMMVVVVSVYVQAQVDRERVLRGTMLSKIEAHSTELKLK